jgi:hypothetical protein
LGINTTHPIHPSEYRFRYAATSTRHLPLTETPRTAPQLGRLWSLTSDRGAAEVLFRRVLDALQAMDPPTGGEKSHKRPARTDRTTAELVKLLNLDGRTQDAHDAERAVATTNELAVSWEGVSINMWRRFAEENANAINFLSTDAVVERIVKPSSVSQLLFDPAPKGRALIEMTHAEFKGKPTFFLSHAWRQTFSVSDRPWRGGLVQAILHAVPEGRTPEDTFIWADIFCVNQHLPSPYGGLLAFAFEPLRNAMLECEAVLLFFETWDDPAPLGRVWCLDELRNALLLGKEVRIIMPPQALDSFRQAASKDPAAVLEDIRRVVGRIDIEQASASFRIDREFVLKVNVYFNLLYNF